MSVERLAACASYFLSGCLISKNQTGPAVESCGIMIWNKLICTFVCVVIHLFSCWVVYLFVVCWAFCWIELAGLGNFLFADTDIENRCHEQWPSSNASLYISHPSQIVDFLYNFCCLIFWYSFLGTSPDTKLLDCTALQKHIIPLSSVFDEKDVQYK